MNDAITAASTAKRCGIRLRKARTQNINAISARTNHEHCPSPHATIGGSGANSNTQDTAMAAMLVAPATRFQRCACISPASAPCSCTNVMPAATMRIISTNVP